jgi:hypothetical protein
MSITQTPSITYEDSNVIFKLNNLKELVDAISPYTKDFENIEEETIFTDNLAKFITENLKYLKIDFIQGFVETKEE